MPTITFVNEKKEIQVPDGANLREEALKAGVNLYYGFNGVGASLNKVFNCHGFGAVRHLPRADHQGDGEHQPDDGDGKGEVQNSAAYAGARPAAVPGVHWP